MKHLNFLDGLRAISILLVMSFHIKGAVSGTVPNGWLGVDVFFVISGFLITTLLLNERAQTGTVNLRNFYVRRCLRLMPAYWLFLVALLVIHPAQNGKMVPAFFSSLFYLSDYDLALYWGNILGSGYEGTWSLAVEEKFYLIWPAVVLFFGMRSRWAAVIAIVSCQLFKVWLCHQHAPPLRLLGAFDTHVDELMFGCLAAHLFAVGSVRSALSNWKFGNVASLALVGGLTYILLTLKHPNFLRNPDETSVLYAVTLPAFAGLSALLVLLCSSNQKLWLARALSFKPLMWLGVVSYSLYLWHPVVVQYVSVWAHTITRNPYKHELTLFLVSFAAAALSYYVIERPFLKLKKRFEFKGDTASGAADLKVEVMRRTQPAEPVGIAR